jgi:hypothetical protein
MLWIKDRDTDIDHDSSSNGIGNCESCPGKHYLGWTVKLENMLTMNIQGKTYDDVSRMIKA